MHEQPVTRVTYRDMLGVGLTPQQVARWTTSGYLRADQPHPGTGRVAA